MTTYGFLHTADTHVPVFDELLAALSPADHAVHVVDASLLADARRRHGVDDDLRRRIGARIAELAGRGAAAAVCTCSPLGATAEETGGTLGLPVARVDRSMARRAVRSGHRIAIVAAVESTIGPTRSLLEESAAAAGRRVELIDAPCLDAWSLFEAGDLDGYYTRLASHLASIDGAVDVIVLAQASMAPLESRVRPGALLLSSPRLAVVELVSGRR